MSQRLDKSGDFVVRLASPFNGGPALARLTESFETPVEHFFVRSHGEVPDIDRTTYRLAVEGEVERPLSLSLEELTTRFPKRSLVATLQCAGNRRAELAGIRAIPGEVPWGSEAIGNAAWSGVALADVIEAARPRSSALHVELEGADETERLGRRVRFGGSIPIAKATAPEVLLALEMNGAPLTPMHGAPLRAVVSGYIGARSVKWLRAIRLRATPSENYFQTHAYRFERGDDAADHYSLGELHVSSVIAAPVPGARIRPGIVRIEGVAIAGGRTIDRVEVSVDNGAGWRAATLDTAGTPWTWRRWSIDWELPPGDHEIVARAWDSAARTQPERLEDVWNRKGYVNNAWARVRVSA